MQYFWLYVASVIGAFCTLIALTAMRRGETHNIGKFGWILLTLLSPPVGLVLFLFLGGKKVSAEHAQRESVKLPSCNDSGKCQESDSLGDCHDPRSVGQDSDLVKIAIERGLPPPCGRNRVELATSPESLLQHLWKVVDSATERLYIHTFILTDDAVAAELLDRLCAKARSGVQVRLMVDGFGSFFYPEDSLQRLRDAGGQAAKFKPLTRFSRFAYLNFRNHRKIVVADGRRVLLGGANLVQYEMTCEPDDDTWVDLSLRIDGHAARQIEAVFASDWLFATGEQLDLGEDSFEFDGTPDSTAGSSGSTSLQVVPVGPDSPTEIIGDLWLAAINRANKRVWIATPYFVPPPMAMQSLVMAKRRGLDVRLMIPQQSDMASADRARFDFCRELEQVGVRIFRYEDRVIHAKTVLIDDEVAYVGSANFDMRSFFLNYELIVGIMSKNEIQSVADWFEELQQYCIEGDLPCTVWRKVVGTAARMVAAEL